MVVSVAAEVKMAVRIHKNNHIKKELITLHPRFSGFTVLSFIFLLIFGFGGGEQIYRGDWRGIILFAFGCMPLFMNYRQRIYWNNDTLIYRDFFRTKKIKFSDIGKFDVEFINWSKVENRSKPLVSLFIWSKNSKQPAMLINIRFFSMKDLTRLADRLRLATGSSHKLTIRSIVSGKVEEI